MGGSYHMSALGAFPQADLDYVPCHLHLMLLNYDGNASLISLMFFTSNFIVNS